MNKYLLTIAALIAVFLLSACGRLGWGTLDETNSACFAAREKFIARDMNGSLQILTPNHSSNRTLIQKTLTEANIELSKLSHAELGDLVSAVVTYQSSPNVSFHIGTDEIYFNQGTSSASTTFKYKKHEVIFACNFERNFGVWRASSVNWSTKKI
jgi:hypothetical protein